MTLSCDRGTGYRSQVTCTQGNRSQVRKKSFITVTDQFCGAGGSSIGATKAGAELRLALNHWQLAIDTHNTNFPDAGEYRIMKLRGDEPPWVGWSMVNFNG